MAIFNGGTITQNPAPLTVGQTVGVGASAVLTSDTGGVLELGGVGTQNYGGAINGTIQGYSPTNGIVHGIWFKATGSSTHTLNVGITGSIMSYKGNAIHLDVNNLLSSLNNAGSIVADQPTGAAIFAAGAGNSSFTNSGLIASTLGNGIHLTGSGIHSIFNTGAINAFDQGKFAIISTHATGSEFISNDGIIRGDLSLGGGSDTVRTENGRINGTVNLGAGNDSFYGSTLSTVGDLAKGDAGDDFLFGYAGNDRLDGGAGDDVVVGGAGDDILIGGTNTAIGDFLSYYQETGGVTVNLSITVQQDTKAGGLDTISGFEDMEGSAFNDTLTGSATDNLIWGLAGADNIKGGGGADLLNGGLGKDTLSGGAGNDTFVFNSVLDAAGTNRDVITDFVSNTAAQNDVIQLENTGAGLFNALVALGTLNSAFFVANATGFAGDTNDRIIYETDTGEIYYDPTGGNGTAAGAADAVLFFTLNTKPTISNLDFVVI